MKQQYLTPPSVLSDRQIEDLAAGKIDWKEIVAPIGDDLVSTPSTAPGRPRTFLLEPELKTAPFSCELIKYNNHLFDLLESTSRFLRCGAGVKVILDDYQRQSPAVKGFKWRFYLSEDHPDYCNLSPEHREYLIDKDNLDRNSEINQVDIFIDVADSMESEKDCATSIQSSWLEMIAAAQSGKFIVFDLSNIRPYGQINSRGLMASGPIGLGKLETDEESCSFFSVYQRLAQYLIEPAIKNLLILLGTLNDTLRRGGFKRGIVTTSMSYKNKAFEDYLKVPLIELPGGHKKGARLDKQLLETHSHLIPLIVEKRNEQSLFLAKINPDDVYDNVCVGLGIVHLGTCLVWRFNLGMIRNMRDIPAWMNRVATQITLLHLNWRSQLPDIAKIVAPLNKDLQVGMDIMGLANFLGHWKISYADFTEALEEYNRFATGEKVSSQDSIRPVLQFDSSSNARQLVYWLAQGYASSTIECDRLTDAYGIPRMQRIHTPSEPAQNHSYQTQDIDGYATCRAIFAPSGKSTRRGVRVRRVSNHQKNVMVNHGHVETAGDVGPQLHERLCSAFSKFVELTGRSHGYMSFDDWQQMTEARLGDWLLNSPLQSMYYNESRNFDQSYLTKAAPSLCSLNNSRQGECAVCAE